MQLAKQSNPHKIQHTALFDFNWGEIVFRKFLPKKAALVETNYGPFVF